MGPSLRHEGKLNPAHALIQGVLRHCLTDAPRGTERQNEEHLLFFPSGTLTFIMLRLVKENIRLYTKPTIQFCAALTKHHTSRVSITLLAHLPSIGQGQSFGTPYYTHSLHGDLRKDNRQRGKIHTANFVLAVPFDPQNC